MLVSRTIEKIKELKDRYQLTVLMAEQNFTQALRIADRGYVIVHGKIAFEGKSADELNNNDLIRKFYLGTLTPPSLFGCGAAPKQRRRAGCRAASCRQRVGRFTSSPSRRGR